MEKDSKKGKERGQVKPGEEIDLRGAANRNEEVSEEKTSLPIFRSQEKKVLAKGKG